MLISQTPAVNKDTPTALESSSARTKTSSMFRKNKVQANQNL